MEQKKTEQTPAPVEKTTPAPDSADKTQEQMALLHKYIGEDGEKQDYKNIFPIAKAISEGGNSIPAVEWVLGKAYLYGLGTKTDKAEAIKHYERAAKGGFKSAKEQLVHIKKNFIKVINIDDEKAIEIFDYKRFKKKPIKMQFVLVAPEGNFEWSADVIAPTIINASCYDVKCPWVVKVKSIDTNLDKYEFEVKIKEVKQFTALI